jgi:hypothetical protein
MINITKGQPYENWNQTENIESVWCVNMAYCYSEVAVCYYEDEALQLINSNDIKSDVKPIKYI